MYYVTIVLIAVLLLLWRLFFRAYLANYAPARNVLIVGTGKVADMLADEIRGRKNLGFRFVGFVGDPTREIDVTSNQNHLGEYGRIEEIIRKHNVHDVVVAISDRRGLYPVKEMLHLRVHGQRFQEWPSYFEKMSGRIPVDSLSPSFFIFSGGFQKSKVILHIRRGISFMVSVIALIVLAPVFLLLSILINLDTPGPIFYRQERVGWNGKRFRLIKFRSMIEQAEAKSGPQWATENDPRITRVGRILLDILWRVKAEFGVPVAAYSVSGEFAMLKAAARLGWLDEERTMLEMLTANRRAGADLIVTYFAREAARVLRQQER